MHIKKAPTEESTHPGRFLVLGIALGVAIGAAVGYPGAGIAAGVAIALIFGHRQKRR
jgi:hypothetical protein